MKLYYQDEIGNVDNCPLANNPKVMTLYRLIKDGLFGDEDLLPKAANPRNKHMSKTCEAWGMSTYDNVNSVISLYNGMNSKLQSRFSHIASVEVDDLSGIKYQTFDDPCHFTFFPFVDVEISDKFVTVTQL